MRARHHSWKPRPNPAMDLTAPPLARRSPAAVLLSVPQLIATSARGTTFYPRRTAGLAYPGAEPRTSPRGPAVTRPAMKEERRTAKAPAQRQKRRKNSEISSSSGVFLCFWRSWRSSPRSSASGKTSTTGRVGDVGSGRLGVVSAHHGGTGSSWTWGSGCAGRRRRCAPAPLGARRGGQVVHGLRRGARVRAFGPLGSWTWSGAAAAVASRLAMHAGAERLGKRLAVVGLRRDPGHGWVLVMYGHQLLQLSNDSPDPETMSPELPNSMGRCASRCSATTLRANERDAQLQAQRLE